MTENQLWCLAIAAAILIFTVVALWRDIRKSRERHREMQEMLAKRREDALRNALVSRLREEEAKRSRQRFVKPTPPSSAIWPENGPVPPRSIRKESDAPELFVPLALAAAVFHDRPSTPSEVGDNFASGRGGDFGGGGASASWGSSDDGGASSSSSSSD